MKKLAFVLILCLVLASGSALAQGGLSKTQIQEIASAVVQIVALDPNGEPLSTGSGTIIDSKGTIFTNRHVVEGGSDYAIMILEDMAEPPVHRYFASVVGVSDVLDFAVLQIDRDENGFNIKEGKLKLPFLDAGNTEVGHGDRIYIFGFPGIGGGYLVMTQGSITTVENDTIGGDRVPVWFQTDAEISPGNSGGLAVNEKGEFIGIPTAVQSEERTLGRLGGITPLIAIEAVMDSGRGLVALEDIAVSNQQQQQQQPVVATGGISVDCGGGVTFDNGVEITINQMRTGFTYTATAVGIDGFDPVLAVLDPATGEGLCTDDEPAARSFEVSLPTSGYVAASKSTAQVKFSNNLGGGMADVSLVVGSVGNTPGQFVVVLEGMAATQADGYGDPFSVRLTPGMIGSGVPLTVYMIAKTDRLDALTYLADADFNVFTTDDGTEIYCDDAGSDSCWGNSSDLSNSGVTMVNGQALGGFQYDAMLSIPMEAFQGVTLEDDLALTFVMTSSGRSTFGDYVVAFHAATQ